jgi:cytochrome c peroxidase
MGKAIAAYERLILPGPAPFDHYVVALLAGDDQAMQTALEPDAVAGLRVFIGKGNCINCHNGPLFTNHGFQNVGVPIAKGLGIDEGRYRGVLQVKSSEFNCLGKYSDAGENDCAELRFAQLSRDEIIPVAPIGYTELFTIRVTDNELQQLEAFLRSLSGPPVIAPALLHPPSK